VAKRASTKKPAEDRLDISSIVFLGRLSERLSAVIEAQTLSVFNRMGVIIPARSCSLLVTLSKVESAAAADLARELGQAHQLVLQKLPKLVRLGLVTHSEDEHDARRRLFQVTRQGREQLKKFDRCCDLIARAYDGLFAEVGNAHEVILLTIDALEKKPLADRIPPRR
jgi:DNA-binding MarR family transcriptional regulator